jgi:histidinol-phosphate aminotransferase
MRIPLSRRKAMTSSGVLALLAAAPVSQAANTTAQTLIRLHLNENPYGPSDQAKQAMQAALNDGWAYDNEDVLSLRRLIAAKEGLKPENVIITEGSTELLRIAGLVYGRGKDIVAGLPTFLSMMQYATRNGGQVEWVNLDADMRLDLNAMEAKVTDRTGAVYICNPNNPTGTVLDAGNLRKFIESVSKRTLVLVDEAYIDLADDPEYMTMVDQVRQGRGVLIARTFSKIHGMAGLRVGYGLARADIIKRLEDLRMSAPNRMGLKAAMASYQDAEFLDYSRAMVRACISYTSEFLETMKLKYTPTQANFILFDVGRSSVEFASFMREKFILVNPQLDPLGTWCRVSMGRMEHMEAFTLAAREFFNKT